MFKKITYGLLILVLMGCSASKVVYDYDVKTDFSKYNSYDYFEDVGEGLNELDIKRFTRSLDHVLDSLQLKKADKPSFYINVISEKSELVRDDIGIGLGTGGRNVGVGITTGISFGGKKLYEQINVYFVDAQSNTLFWQGVLKVKTRERIKPQKRVEMIKEMVKKVLSKYPPKK